MLGELLEIMHTCTDRWTTLHADLHEWQDDDGLAAASQARSTSFGVTRSRPPGLPAGGRSTGVHERSLTLVATSDLGVRLEARDEDGGTRLVVVQPDGAVLVVEPDGTTENLPAGRLSIAWLYLGLVGPVLAPDQLAGTFRLQVTGTATVAGRECLLADARSRPEHLRQGAEPYGHGIDRGRLAVDRATGLILRLEAVHDGRPVRRVEVTDLVLDAAVDPSTFSVEPPAGSVPPDPAHHSSLPPAEAARHVPFTVFAPAASLGDYPWTAFVATGPNHPVRLYLHQIGTPLGRHLNRVSILQAADPAALPDVTRWSAVDLDGGPGHAWTEDAATDLVAWRDGTGIWIQNAADLDAARALLQSLRVVPRDGGPGTT